MWPLWLVEMSLQHIQKNSPRLLPKPAKFEKNPPNSYRVIRKTKCGAGGAGRTWSSPIHKQASLAGRLIMKYMMKLVLVWRKWNVTGSLSFGRQIGFRFTVFNTTYFCTFFLVIMMYFYLLYSCKCTCTREYFLWSRTNLFSSEVYILYLHLYPLLHTFIANQQ